MVHLCPQQGPRKGSLYINICSWKRVPAPQDPSRPLPVCAGKLETITNEGQGKRQSYGTGLWVTRCKLINWCFSFAGCYTVLDMAFNPAVLQDSKKDNTEVCMLALSFAQQQYGLRLSQEYTVVSCSPKSSPDDLHRRLGFQQWPNASKQPDTGKTISLVSR